MSEHGNCPACNANFDGGSIWQSLRDQAVARVGEEAADAEADRQAAMYGATRTSGQWGRKIGIYSQERDRTVAYRCPDCDHEWERP